MRRVAVVPVDGLKTYRWTYPGGELLLGGKRPFLFGYRKGSLLMPQVSQRLLRDQFELPG